MSQLISRILLTILLFPSAVLVLFIAFIFLEEVAFPQDSVAMLASTLLTCAYIVGYWLLLWRRDVVWTPRRVRSSLLLALGAVAAGIVLAWLISLALPYEEELGTILGSLAATVIWIGATVFAWRETPGERAARLARAGADTLVCPSCGYNLTGLREARCPECGNSFTLNDLLARQPERVQMEVERA